MAHFCIPDKYNYECRICGKKIKKVLKIKREGN